MRSGHCMDTIDSPKVGIASVARLGLRRLGDPIGRALDRLLLWTERSGQRHRLAELNDHMLRDIGLSRANAMAEITKPFWRA